MGRASDWNTRASVCFCHFLEVGRVGPADGRNALDIDETSLSAQGLTVASQNPCAILPSRPGSWCNNEQPGAVGVGKVAASPPIGARTARRPRLMAVMQNIAQDPTFIVSAAILGSIGTIAPLSDTIHAGMPETIRWEATWR